MIRPFWLQFGDCREGLTEEVPGAVETLRCPTCLNQLSDGGVKHCPACGARVRTRRKSSAVSDDAVFSRPRVLVERELQARIEAQTAAHFRQRRRAAKTARRIASLPSSLFESGVVVEPRTGAWSAMPPAVIDLPVNAIHETPRPGELHAARAPDEAIAARPRWRPWKPAHHGVNDDATGVGADEVDAVDAVDAVDVEVVDVVEAIDVPQVAEAVEAVEVVQVEEIVVHDAPAPSLFTPEPDFADAEPPAHDAGRATVIAGRWRAWKASRNGSRNSNSNGDHAESDDVETETVADQPYDWEADQPDDTDRRGRTSWIPDRWRTWTQMPHDAAAPAAPAAVAPEPPAPPPRRRRGRIEPREFIPAARAPKGAENWQPSESLWAKRVFNSRAQGGEVASWPRTRPPKQDVTAGE